MYKHLQGNNETNVTATNFRAIFLNFKLFLQKSSTTEAVFCLLLSNLGYFSSTIETGRRAVRFPTGVVQTVKFGEFETLTFHKKIIRHPRRLVNQVSKVQ